MTAREAVVTLESGATAALRRGANDLGVVCLHPWGPLGGSRDDPHVLTAANFFAGRGCHTCRVDFRGGVGRGHGSVADAVAAAAALRDGGCQRIVVVGYSYGSLIAIRAAAKLPDCVGWVAVNPPLSYAWFLYSFCSDHAAAARASTLPKMLLHATEDVFCSNSSFDSFVETVPEPRTIVRVEGASHFDVRRPLAAALAEWGGAILSSK